LNEDHAAALEELKSLRDLMDSGTRIARLPDHLRVEFLGGCLFAIGIMQSWRQSPEALAVAERIESFSPMYALNADQLRAMYHSGRGDLALAERYRQRVETRALQAGSAWQVVALGPITAHLSALWTHDVLLAKRAAAELERMSREIPSFRHEARRARAAYLVLTGRFGEAVELMNDDDARPTLAGWSRGQAVLARAHNRLGEHARARELCQSALAGRSEANLSFVVMNLHLQLELALADAALGDFAAARSRSDRLLARHADLGPIALGALHETRARVALLEGDLPTCREHCESMRRCYDATESASLRELTQRLLERLTVAERGDARNSATPAVLLGDDGHSMTRMRLIFTHTEATFERRALRGLQMALELTGASEGFVISTAANGEPIGLEDRSPAQELVAWARAQLDSNDLEATALELPGETTGPRVLRLGDLQYCVAPLVAPGHGLGPAVGLVLGFRGVSPHAPNSEFLAFVGAHLLETHSRS
jgi:tetratricopeptide (TPR) repeat protein